MSIIDNRFLEKSKINNFERILDIILNSDKIHGRIAIEHIGDILFFINKHDKERDMQDPELKKAAFTVIKALLATKSVELDWEFGWASSKYRSPPKTADEIFDILDKYWYKNDGSGLDKNYLLFFKRKKNN